MSNVTRGDRLVAPLGRGRERPSDTQDRAIIAIASFAIATLFIELEVDGPIVPGQPITFSWKVQTIAVRPLDLGQVTFTLSLVDQFGNTDAGGQLYSKTLPKTESLTPQDYQSAKYSAQLVGDIASRVYKFGAYPMRLVLTGTGSDGPFESNDVVLVVQGEPIDYTWWNWTVPVTRNVSWKVDKPAVQGAVTNKSKYSAITCNATIYETNYTDGNGIPKEIGADQSNPPIGVGQTATISFGAVDFSKSWDWFITGLWMPNGTTVERTYGYYTELDITDEFQNGYAPVDSLEIFIDFRVSDGKIAALSIAGGLMAGAAVLFVAGAATICFGGAALIGAAGSMVTAAAISGSIAKDPPIPDVLYRQRVKVAQLTVPRKAFLLRDFAPVAETLQLTFSTLAAVDALGTIAGRQLGARIAGDRAAQKRQAQDARALRQGLREDAVRLHSVSRAAAALVARHKGTTPEALRVAFDRLRNDEGFRNQVREQFIKSGRTAQEWSAMERFVEVPAIREQIADASVVVRSIGFWAERLASVTAKETADARAAVAGRPTASRPRSRR